MDGIDEDGWNSCWGMELPILGSTFESLLISFFCFLEFESFFLDIK